VGLVTKQTVERGKAIKVSAYPMLSSFQNKLHTRHAEALAFNSTPSKLLARKLEHKQTKNKQTDA